MEASSPHHGNSAMVISPRGRRDGPGQVLADIVTGPGPDRRLTVLQRPAEISLIIKDGRLSTARVSVFRLLRCEEPPRRRMFSAG